MVYYHIFTYHKMENTKRKGKNMGNKELGGIGERAAAELLQMEGYEILERNYRIRTGEIDLIARDARYLVFIEVKYRKNLQMGDPLEAVDVRKQQRIYQTARYYLHQKKWENMPCRFDVIGITGTQICHIRNAFGSI